jgi:hypothetical protein
MTSKNHHAQHETALRLLAAICLAFFLIAIGQFSLNGGDARAQLSYIKLAKFSASLAIYALTMLWLLKQLTSAGPILVWASIAACLGGVMELSTLLTQALVPGWQSAALLAISRLAILPPTFLIVVAFKRLLNEIIPLALRRALLWATGLAILGCLPGAVMLIEISQHQSSSALDSFFGLKLAHFIGLHTLQLMPMTYFLVSKQSANINSQIKVIDSIGLSLLTLIAALTISSTTENTQVITTAILTLCAVFVAARQGRRAWQSNTAPGASIIFSKSKL